MWVWSLFTHIPTTSITPVSSVQWCQCILCAAFKGTPGCQHTSIITPKGLVLFLRKTKFIRATGEMKLKSLMQIYRVSSQSLSSPDVMVNTLQDVAPFCFNSYPTERRTSRATGSSSIMERVTERAGTPVVKQSHHHHLSLQGNSPLDLFSNALTTSLSLFPFCLLCCICSSASTGGQQVDDRWLSGWQTQRK